MQSLSIQTQHLDQNLKLGDPSAPWHLRQISSMMVKYTTHLNNAAQKQKHLLNNWHCTWNFLDICLPWVVLFLRMSRNNSKADWSFLLFRLVNASSACHTRWRCPSKTPRTTQTMCMAGQQTEPGTLPPPSCNPSMKLCPSCGSQFTRRKRTSLLSMLEIGCC